MVPQHRHDIGMARCSSPDLHINRQTQSLRAAQRGDASASCSRSGAPFERHYFATTSLAEPVTDILYYIAMLARRHVVDIVFGKAAPAAVRSIATTTSPRRLATTRHTGTAAHACHSTACITGVTATHQGYRRAVVGRVLVISSLVKQQLDDLHLPMSDSQCKCCFAVLISRVYQAMLGARASELLKGVANAVKGAI